MIEVESKFTISEEKLAKILDKAEKIEELKICDEYFDDEKYSLMHKDIWLRKRQGKWEIKIPVAARTGKIKSYLENNNVKFIEKTVLEITGLELTEMTCYAEINKHRQKYQVEEFILDLDLADYGASQYQVNEIELMAENEEERLLALEKIEKFAEENEMTLGGVRGTLMEFLFREKSKLYEEIDQIRRRARA